MEIFFRKNARGLSLWSRISISVFLFALLAACGDDAASSYDYITSDNPELSSSVGKSSSSKGSEKKSSSSTTSEKKNSSSSSKIKTLSTSSSQSDDDEDLLNVIYAVWESDFSGFIALDEFDKAAKVNIIELDSADDYDETKNVFSSEIGKNGAYEIKKINLVQPYARFTADGKINSVIDGKSAAVTLSTLGDATSGEIFNLNLLTTIEAECALQRLAGKNKLSFEAAKSEASESVWNMFHLESIDFDKTETVHVTDASESGAALLAATVLLQAGADGDFAKFFKSVVADVAKNGKWDDSTARIAIADWALSNNLNDGYASIRKTLEKRMTKVADFEKYLKKFYLKELGFPKCDAETAGNVFFVTNKSSKFYAAKYDDISKSKERFVCNEQKGWSAIPDSLKDFMGESPAAKDGDVRLGAFSGEFLVYDGSKKEWRKATAVEKDRYFVKTSNIKEFVDIQDVYENIKDDERVIFVLRHAERGDDTSKGGTLTDNGKKQSEEVGARLKKFKDDFVLGASEFLRAHQTVESMAKGRGQSYDKRDTIPQLNDDWYNKDNDAVEKAKNECGGGWEVTSKYAYTGAYSTGANAAYYDLSERSVELIEDVLLKKYTKEKFVLLSSHDKLMVPLVAYCSNLQINLKKYDGGNWINYLAGVAIIVDKAGNRRYIAVRGLKSGFMN